MTKFDVVNYLESEEDIAGYLEAAKEEVSGSIVRCGTSKRHPATCQRHRHR